MLSENSYLLLLGSNHGLREQHLRTALEKIRVSIGFVKTKSSVYETAAWGKTDQPSFLNQAIQVDSPFDASSVLNRIHIIENEMGRQRIEKWGERTIDIDILFAQNLIFRSTDLIIPHPAIANRRFTLTALLEIVPEFVHPVIGKTIRQLMAECTDPLSVVKITS